MRVYCLKDYQAMSRRAAAIMAAEVVANPNCVLGLATGSTPVGAYEQLAKWYEKGDLSFRSVRTVNLDEYAGLGPEHPQSYRYFMQENLFNHVDLLAENTHLPNGLAPDPAAECIRYNGIIKSVGGIDLQLLGIGHNGHIGFNEPNSAFMMDTHKVSLTARTIEANARFFATLDEVPKAAYTMGIRTIMQARRILVVASGPDKSEIVYRAFAGPVTPEVPASILQIHPNVTLCGDEAALSLLVEAGALLCD